MTQSNIVNVIAAIKTACTPIFNTIREELISTEMLNIGDEQLPALFIGLNPTTYGTQQHSSIEKIYNFQFLILLPKSDTPLTNLILKEDAFLTKLFNDVALKDLYQSDSLKLQKSTASNIMPINQNGNSDQTMINATMDIVTLYKT